jgi:hypothetical protein
VFRRNRGGRHAKQDAGIEPFAGGDDATSDGGPGTPDEVGAGETSADPEAVAAGDEGPYDSADAADTDEHVDLGGILLPGRDGMELRIDYDEASGAVGAVTVVIGNAALQVQPFAAPRRTGIWDEVRTEIAAGITAQGGVATEKEGPFGVELRARVPGVMPDGSQGTQLVRFMGVDGPRWFLRGVLTGAAYDDPAAAAPLEDVFRHIVVVRGSEAMAPREPIPLRLPQAAPEPAAEGADDGEERASLDPFERGPEITEVR